MHAIHIPAPPRVPPNQIHFIGFVLHPSRQSSASSTNSRKVHGWTIPSKVDIVDQETDAETANIAVIRLRDELMCRQDQLAGGWTGHGILVEGKETEVR
jgi:hypothetical protein